MPNRMLRDWTASDKVNSLTVHAERFFVRLIMKADDHGCYYGDPKKLKAFLFPLLDDVRETDLLRWAAECEKAGLVALYEVESKRYIQINEFGQRLRQQVSKFPMPAACGHLTDGCPPKRTEEEEKGSEQKGPLAGSNLFRKPVIPTKQDVLESILAAGGTKEMAKSFYEKYEATGWYLNGSPVINHRALASKFVTTWRGNEKKTNEPTTTYKTL